MFVCIPDRVEYDAIKEIEIKKEIYVYFIQINFKEKQIIFSVPTFLI